MVQTPISSDTKVSKVEELKERSNYLREPLATELLEDTNHFTENAGHILKFHGSYQQDNRDNRVKGQEKDYQFMLRTRNPGGFIPAQLYLTLDQVADEYGNNTLRATTRQGFQVHGVLKKNLKTVIATIINNMGSTLGACGDLNRNVMSPPAPFKNAPEYQYAWQYAENIADLFKPQTSAYYDIWLDGEKIISAEAPEVAAARQNSANGTVFNNQQEPLYGDRYMPRKFKCCVTVPGDNSVDLYTHDVSVVVITDDNKELQGFNVLVGGGLGRTHNKEETFPRIADELGYVDKEDIYELMKSILATQRDYGDRFNRRHARMKYLIEDWGLQKFKQTVETYFGKEIQPFKELPEWQYLDYLGWHEQGDGKLFLGISIENGRIKDVGDFQLKKALKQIIQTYELPIRLTPNHNLIIYEIDPQWQTPIEEILEQNGVLTSPEQIHPLTRYSMACPALPTCALAITESERALPSVIERIDALLHKMGLPQEKFVIRMTGCPNGCARPYMAELGLVGSAPGFYQVWLGGSPNQTRLAEVYLEKQPIDQIEALLEPILVLFKKYKNPEESFGDFCHRIGLNSIRKFANSYKLGSYTRKTKKTASAFKARKNQNRVGIAEELFPSLKKMSVEEKKPMNQIVADALKFYFEAKGYE